MIKLAVGICCGLLLLPVLVLGAFAGDADVGVDLDLADSTELQRQVLSDPAIHFTGAARADVSAGRVDPRVLGVLLAIARNHDLGPVGPLIGGHTHFVKGTRRVSNHVFGRAVDILGVDGMRVSVANPAARSLMQQILVLPSPIRPDELGGPWRLPSSVVRTFTDASHATHIHVGFAGESLR